MLLNIELYINSFLWYINNINIISNFGSKGFFIVNDFFSYIGILVLIIVGGLEIVTKNTKLWSISLWFYCVLGVNLIWFVFSIYAFNFLALNINISGADSFQFSVYAQFIKLSLCIFGLLMGGILKFNKFNESLLFIYVYILITLGYTLVTTTNFMIMFLALEGFSLLSYILATYTQTYGSIIAASKYFIFGTFGSIWILWGIAQLYLIAPSLSFNLWVFIIQTTLVENTNSIFFETVDFASSLFVMGLSIKLGAAPVHQWVADVYAGVNIVITFFFATFIKVVLIFVFIKLTNLMTCDLIIDFFIVCSLIIGCLNAIRQTEIKRFIAYSSIVHTAFLLTGDIISTLVYLETYILSNILLFLVLISISNSSKELVYLSDLSQVRHSNYLDLVSVAIAIASAAGLPPLAGFYGKFLVFTSLVEDLYLYNNLSSYIILIINMLITLITFFYYMRIVSYLVIKDDTQPGWQGSINLLPSTVWIDYVKYFILFMIVGWTISHASSIKFIEALGWTLIL